MRVGRGSGWRGLGFVGGRLVAAGLGLVAADRALRPERRPVLIGIQGIAVWLLAPALPLAGLAVRRRRWVMAGVTLGLGAAQLVWVAGAVGRHGRQPAPVGSVPLRLVSANVLLDNPVVARLAAELLATDADVILLQEITPENFAVLQTTPLWVAYPGRVADPRPGFHGSLILSRLPVTDGGVIDVEGLPMIQADLSTAAGPVRVVDVHTKAPVEARHTSLWAAQLAALAAMAAPAGSSLVMAGDFNATTDHAPFQRLLAAGKRDAFLVAGRGYGATWPQWRGPVPPMMRLDHVLVDDGVVVVSVHDEANAGSDHRRLVADLALTRRP